MAKALGFDLAMKCCWYDAERWRCQPGTGRLGCCVCARWNASRVVAESSSLDAAAAAAAAVLSGPWLSG
jgi:hypothetical protein